MSQNQLVLPETLRTLEVPGSFEDPEETGLVERFREASRDLVPSVEITLAKRIIRPGSNKVVCLAARTSIPLNDDEVASVSDLALRLSDGTNVALSLSFFNDALGGEYATDTRSLNRYVYDPSHYVKKNDSKLGFVLLGMTFVFVAGIFAFTHTPAALFAQLDPKFRPAVTATAVASVLPIGKTTTRQTSKPTMTRPLTAYGPLPGIKFGPPAAMAQKSSSKSTGTKSYSPSTGTNNVAGKIKSSSPHSKSYEYAKGQGGMLVPPPPPTPYIMPIGSGMQFFDPRQASVGGNPAVRPPRQTAGASKLLDTKSGNQSEIKLPGPEQESQNVSSIELRTYRSRQTEFWPNNDKTNPNADKPNVTAPAPGTDTATVTMQLERIVPASHE